jgi:hypothetical protein
MSKITICLVSRKLETEESSSTRKDSIIEREILPASKSTTASAASAALLQENVVNFQRSSRKRVSYSTRATTFGTCACAYNCSHVIGNDTQKLSCKGESCVNYILQAHLTSSNKRPLCAFCNPHE